MLKHDITSIIQYSKEMHHHCEAWKNAVMAAQYCLPIEILNRYLESDKDKIVLDWGCGDGHFSYLLAKKKLQIHAYSFNEIGVIDAIIKAQTKFVFDQSQSFHPVDLPYENEKFAAVFSVGVLEHVNEFGGNEIASLLEINRILKPGGYCFIFHLPNKYSWIEFLHRGFKHIKLFNKYIHNNLYNSHDIHEMARVSNFSVVEMSRYNLFPRNFFKKLPNFLGNNKSVIFSIAMLEKICSYVLNRFAQNYCVVMQKRK